MHLVEVGHEAHRLPDSSRCGGIYSAANLHPVDDEVDHRLHAHRLDDVEACLKGGGAGRHLPAPFDDMFGTQPESQLAADARAVAGRARRRHREGEPV